MSTATSVQLSEYLDDELLQRNVGQWNHSRLQGLSNREKQWDIIVVPEQSVQGKPTRFRVPDILVMASSAPLCLADPPAHGVRSCTHPVKSKKLRTES
jgi:hypothetical protein